MLKECKWCEAEFETESRRKQLAGGFINECPECVEDRGGDDSPPKYLGTVSGDGKMAGVTILKFETEADREAYLKAHRNNSGQNKGKECQLGGHLTPMSGIKFTTVQKTEAVNHKGKL
jgi:hypothetical protein